jgi:hypothetical protein
MMKEVNISTYIIWNSNFIHPKCSLPIVISGKPGDDALRYQEKAVKQALKEAAK